MADESGEPVFDDGDDGHGEQAQEQPADDAGDQQPLDVADHQGGGPEEQQNEEQQPDAKPAGQNRARNFRRNNDFGGPPNQARFQRVCPSVLKGEACWALSRGKACNYESHTLPEERQGNLYVSHLPLDMTKHDFEALFRPFGSFKDTRFLVHPKTGEPTGVGFVHFHKPEDARKAIEVVNGMRLPGSERPLQCRIAERRGKTTPALRGGRRPPPFMERGGPRRPSYYEEYPGNRPPYYPDREYDYYGPVRRPPPPRGYYPYERSPPPAFERSPPRRDYAEIPPARGEYPPVRGEYPPARGEYPPARGEYPPYGIPPRRPQGTAYNYAPGAGYERDPYR